MSMAPGLVADTTSATTSGTGSYPSRNTHHAQHKQDAPPLYTKHHHHYHQVQPEDMDMGTIEDYSNDNSAPHISYDEEAPALPRRYVNFAQEHGPEELFAMKEHKQHPAPEPIQETAEPPTPYYSPQPLSLTRGLQVPSRRGIISAGFKLPPLLTNVGVTKIQWKSFTHEVKSHAYMNGKQFVTFAFVNVGFCVALHFLIPGLAMIPATFIGYHWAKSTERENFEAAHDTGVLEECCQRWNDNYFEPLGLHVAVAPPEMGRMNGMDVASTKLFRYRQHVGIGSADTGWVHEDSREARYRGQEGHYRLKAAYKARIIVVPLEQWRTATSLQQGQGQESGLTAIGDQLIQDQGLVSEALVNTPALGPGDPYYERSVRHRRRRGS